MRRFGFVPREKENRYHRESVLRPRVVPELRCLCTLHSAEGFRCKPNRCDDAEGHPHAAPISPMEDIAIPSFS